MISFVEKSFVEKYEKQIRDVLVAAALEKSEKRGETACFIKVYAIEAHGLVAHAYFGKHSEKYAGLVFKPATEKVAVAIMQPEDVIYRAHSYRNSNNATFLRALANALQITLADVAKAEHVSLKSLEEKINSGEKTFVLPVEK